MPKKLKVKAYLAAGQVLAADPIRKRYACNEIEHAVGRHCVEDYGPEAVFFQNVFGLHHEESFNVVMYRSDHTGMDAPLIELRLMALALAYTLAVEQNNGRQVL